MKRFSRGSGAVGLEEEARKQHDPKDGGRKTAPAQRRRSEQHHPIGELRPVLHCSVDSNM